ncbi:MAG: hypothetical protein Q7S03_03095 [bacterium]|nr:hypothetical protein [bacterium]
MARLFDLLFEVVRDSVEVGKFHTTENPCPSVEEIRALVVYAVNNVPSETGREIEFPETIKPIEGHLRECSKCEITVDRIFRIEIIREIRRGTDLLNAIKDSPRELALVVKNRTESLWVRNMAAVYLDEVMGPLVQDLVIGCQRSPGRERYYLGCNFRYT